MRIEDRKYDGLLKDCFWEYTFTPEDIIRMLSSGTIQEKQFLFEKILLNSTELLNDMALFNKDDLRILIEEYVVPRFNADYSKRRKNILEYYFFDLPLEIEELQWVS